VKPVALLKRRARREAGIPVVAMADVAFLLLVCFLVTAAAGGDTGLYVELPPMPQAGGAPLRIPDRDLLTVYVDAAGGVFVEGERVHRDSVRAEVARHVRNEGRSPGYAGSPDSAVVAFGTDRGTRYGAYVAVLDEIKAAYGEVRDGYARRLAGVPYAVYRRQLAPGARDAVAARYPVRIILAEPSSGLRPGP
jgi:biopolymer transport protein ExbD